jgi:hypothetical protein
MRSNLSAFGMVFWIEGLAWHWDMVEPFVVPSVELNDSFLGNRVCGTMDKSTTMAQKLSYIKVSNYFTKPLTTRGGPRRLQPRPAIQPALAPLTDKQHLFTFPSLKYKHLTMTSL